MPLENQVEIIEALRDRLAQLEADLMRHRLGQDAGEHRFRQLADASPIMIWMSDKDALVSFLNRAWLAFRGRDVALELGNGWTEGVHPDDRDL